jgi:hypothetical protein
MERRCPHRPKKYRERERPRTPMERRCPHRPEKYRERELKTLPNPPSKGRGPRTPTERRCPHRPEKYRERELKTLPNPPSKGRGPRTPMERRCPHRRTQTAPAYVASMSTSAENAGEGRMRPKCTANAYGASMPSSANTNCDNLRSFNALMKEARTFMEELRKGIVHDRWGHRRSKGWRGPSL